jgi:hypothetical protein
MQNDGDFVVVILLYIFNVSYIPEERFSCSFRLTATRSHSNPQRWCRFLMKKRQRIKGKGCFEVQWEGFHGQLKNMGAYCVDCTIGILISVNTQTDV